jgi:hypothetical protein
MPGRRTFRHHFFCLKGIQTNCELRVGGGGKETMQHLRAKQYLADNANRLHIRTVYCPGCSGKHTVALGPEAIVRIEVCAGGSRLRPDVTVETKSGEKWALEVFHTHASGKERNDRLQDMGYRVAEFRATTVIDLCERKLDEGIIILDDNLIRPMCQTCTESHARQKREREREKLEREEKEAKEKLEREEKEAKEKLEREEKEAKEKLEREEKKRKRRHENAIAIEKASGLLEERHAVRLKNKQLKQYVCSLCLNYTKGEDGKWLEQTLPGQNGVRFYCQDCWYPCMECLEAMPLEQIARYARCKQCNLKACQ